MVFAGGIDAVGRPEERSRALTANPLQFAAVSTDESVVRLDASTDAAPAETTPSTCPPTPSPVAALAVWLPVRRLLPSCTFAAVDDDTNTVGEFGVRFLVEAADSNGSASVFECHVPADSRMPTPHSHDGFEETIYGLEGTTTWTIDDETVDVGSLEGVAVDAAGDVYAGYTGAQNLRRFVKK